VNTLVFDIETIPDIELGRRLYDLDGLDEAAVARVMAFKQQQARQTDFLPLPQHRVLAISMVLRSREGLHVFSLSAEELDEREIVRRFFDGIERYSPQLVSWNGGGFDLPVLHYRALRHGIAATRYWEVGDEDREFRYNNYLGRFHWRHLDLMDVLSGYQAGARSSLEQAALLCGFPGKLGMSGDQVWSYYRRGELAAIRQYCETDVLNTYLIFLRFQRMRGIFDDQHYAAEVGLLEAKLGESDAPHLRQFLEAWRNNGHERGNTDHG
jgi:predicted PolB exonuclease-like 3'-5' exonuclease